MKRYRGQKRLPNYKGFVLLQGITQEKASRHPAVIAWLAQLEDQPSILQVSEAIELEFVPLLGRQFFALTKDKEERDAKGG